MLKTIIATFCALCTFYAHAELSIKTLNNSESELKIQKSLNALVQRYDIQKWFFTSKIEINDKAEVPHSHPVLTLNTDEPYVNDEIELLAAFLHEQFHWHLVLNNEQSFQEFTAIIKEQFPNVQKDRPFGSGDEMGTLSHIVVCYLELKALTSLIGEEQAKQKLALKPYYTWVYKTVLDRNNVEKLENLLDGFQLNILTELK